MKYLIYEKNNGYQRNTIGIYYYNYRFVPGFSNKI